MAATKPARPLPRDALRKKLDRLAEQIADGALTAETLQDKITALKVAGTYWGLSRKTDDPGKAETAWDQYAASIYAKPNGKAHDGETDEA